jgi:hypothetical protein
MGKVKIERTGEAAPGGASRSVGCESSIIVMSSQAPRVDGEPAAPTVASSFVHRNIVIVAVQ